MTEDRLAAIVDQWARERPDLDASPMLVIGRLTRLAHLVDGRMRPPFAAAGLANGDFDVLAAVRRDGPPFVVRPVELSRSLLVTTGAISKRLDRLQAQGLVERDAVDDDGRGTLVRLTPAGLEVVDRMIAVHLDNQRRLLAGLTEQERHALAELLARFIAVVDHD